MHTILHSCRRYELFPFVDFYKIASYELLWKDLLVACAKTGKPVVLSTGMATLDEVCYATDILRNAGCTNLCYCIVFPVILLRQMNAILLQLKEYVKPATVR